MSNPKVTFEQKVKMHLSNYKLNKLKISELGTYKYKGEIKEYPHILPIEKKKDNILEEVRTHFFDSMFSKISLHQYFHHLNSSQAMCINFFFPLIEHKLLNLLLSIISVKGTTHTAPEIIGFEKESLVEEGNTRKTNFDFYLQLETGENVYFEIKYTEKGFGNADKDEQHRKKFQEVYWPILKDHPAIEEQYSEENRFLENYQMMRNLIHIDSTSYVVFIFPEENHKVKAQAAFAKDYIIKETWKNHLILMTWEELLDKLRIEKLPQELEKYYQKFERKYFPN